MSCWSGGVGADTGCVVLEVDVEWRVRVSVCCVRSRCCSCGVAYLQHGSITWPEGAW